VRLFNLYHKAITPIRIHMAIVSFDHCPPAAPWSWTLMLLIHGTIVTPAVVQCKAGSRVN